MWRLAVREPSITVFHSPQDPLRLDTSGISEEG